MHLQFSDTVDIGQIATTVSLLIVIITFYIKERKVSKRELQRTNREIYQKLELASIDLFRFDAQSSQISGILQC